MHVKNGFFDIMENKLSSNLERYLSNSLVDWEGDLYNLYKVTDFVLSFISNIKHSFNSETS